jgi:uncharacterized membrane protein
VEGWICIFLHSRGFVVIRPGSLHFALFARRICDRLFSTTGRFEFSVSIFRSIISSILGMVVVGLVVTVLLEVHMMVRCGWLEC